jgi:hypothetical protein
LAETEERYAMQQAATTLLAKINEEKIMYFALFRPITSTVRLTAHYKTCTRVLQYRKTLALKMKTVIFAETAENLEYSIWRIPESRKFMQPPTAETQQQILSLVDSQESFPRRIAVVFKAEAVQHHINKKCVQYLLCLHKFFQPLYVFPCSL